MRKKSGGGGSGERYTRDLGVPWLVLLLLLLLLSRILASTRKSWLSRLRGETSWAESGGRGTTAGVRSWPMPVTGETWNAKLGAKVFLVPGRGGVVGRGGFDSSPILSSGFFICLIARPGRLIPVTSVDKRCPCSTCCCCCCCCCVVARRVVARAASSTAFCVIEDTTTEEFDPSKGRYTLIYAYIWSKFVVRHVRVPLVAFMWQMWKSYQRGYSCTFAQKTLLFCTTRSTVLRNERISVKMNRCCFHIFSICDRG